MVVHQPCQPKIGDTDNMSLERRVSSWSVEAVTEWLGSMKLSGLATDVSGAGID